jgi:hypothetical protein
MKEDPRVREYVDLLDQKVGEIQDSDTFRAYLTAQAKFHSYSFNNVLLIVAQKPDASRVAGYRAWQSMDRFVKQGEKSIGILAPLKRKITDEKTGEESYGVYGFRRVSVFDISQTDGKPLPEVPVPVLDSDAGIELYSRLEGVATDEGLKVDRGAEHFAYRPNTMGFYDRDRRLIAVRADVSQLQQTKTIAHEVGHHFAQHQVSGAESETEAEGVAFVVLAHYGLDSGERSFPYVATWAQKKDVMKAALGQIQRVSQRIIARLEPEVNEQSPAEE